MIAPGEDITGLVEELAGLLDDQIALLDLRRSQLEGLAQAVLQRDEAGMERLLGEIERTLRLQADADQRLRTLRAALGSALAAPEGGLRLSALVGRLHGPQRLAIAARRQGLLRAATRLRRQHLQTSVLLMECARANRLLLECLLRDGQAVTTYGADGSARRQSEAGLMDAEL
jgi:flagellar biosynthesis/type III secretory pathway chaperone